MLPITAPRLSTESPPAPPRNANPDGPEQRHQRAVVGEAVRGAAVEVHGHAILPPTSCLPAASVAVMLPPRPLAPMLCANKRRGSLLRAPHVAVQIADRSCRRRRRHPRCPRRRRRRSRHRRPRSAQTSCRPGRPACRSCRSASNAMLPPLPLLPADSVTLAAAALGEHRAAAAADRLQEHAMRTQPFGHHVAGVGHREIATVAARAVRCAAQRDVEPHRRRARWRRRRRRPRSGTPCPRALSPCVVTPPSSCSDTWPPFSSAAAIAAEI